MHITLIKSERPVPLWHGENRVKLTKEEIEHIINCLKEQDEGFYKETIKKLEKI